MNFGGVRVALFALISSCQFSSLTAKIDALNVHLTNWSGWNVQQKVINFKNFACLKFYEEMIYNE